MTIPLRCIEQRSFSPICPINWCHNIVYSTRQVDMFSYLGQTTLSLLLVCILPKRSYNVIVQTPITNTIASHTIFYVSFSNIECTTTFPILLTETRFWYKPRICNTIGSVPILPYFRFNEALLHSTILVGESYTNSNHLHCTYHTNITTLCEVSYDTMDQSWSTESYFNCVPVKGKCTYPLSSDEYLPSVNLPSSNPFSFSNFNYLQLCLQFLTLLHHQHVFIVELWDLVLDIPHWLQLYIGGFFLFLYLLVDL